MAFLRPTPFATLTLYIIDLNGRCSTAAISHFKVVNDGYAGFSIEGQECLINANLKLENDRVSRNDYFQACMNKIGSSVGYRGMSAITPFDGELRKPFVKTIKQMATSAAEAILECKDVTVQAEIEIFGLLPFKEIFTFKMKKQLHIAA